MTILLLFMSEKIKNNWPWAIIIIALILMHSQHQLDNDEGVLLNAAWNVFNNRVLYIQNFEFIPPLAPYLLSWWWKISGASFLSAWFLGILIGLASALALYKINKELKIKKWKLLSPAIFVIMSSFWPMINHNAFSITAILWANYFLIKKDRLYYLIFSGFLFGLSILTLQHKGVAALIGALIYLLIKYKNKKIKIKEIIYFIISATLPLLWLLRWPIKTIYADLIVFPIKNYPETNYVSLVLLIITLVIGAALLYIASIEETKNKNKIALIAITGSVMLISSVQRADATHVLQSAVFILPIINIVFEKCFNKKYDYYWVVFILLIIGYLLAPKPFFENKIVEKIKLEIAKNCPSNIFYAGPFMPGIYFEMRSSPPIPYSMLITRQQTEEQFQESAEQLRNSPPECAILNYATVEKFRYSQNNPLDKFLISYYRRYYKIGNLYIMKR